MGIIIRFFICFGLFFSCFQTTFAETISEKAEPKIILPTVATGNILIQIETSMGTIYLELYKEIDPVTVDYFLKNVDYGYYKNILFHRIIDGFMIQAGKFDKNFNAKNSEKNKLKNQSKTNGLRNNYGSIAIVYSKTDPNIATDEFFINLSQNNELDGNEKEFGYAVFGKIIQGMDVIRKISRIKTWQKDGNLYAPFYPEEALIKDITRVRTNSSN